MSTTALSGVQRAHTMQIRAESWRDGELLSDDVPVADGGEERDQSLTVPERITLTVPRRDRGTDWSPIAPAPPLAAYGQQLRISYGVDVGGGFEWINRGWFLITEATTDGDTVSVAGRGPLPPIHGSTIS